MEGAGNAMFDAKFAGKEALNVLNEKGYLRGRLFYKNAKKHRVIYKWMTGIDPYWVDHEDGNKLNNRWKNLRDVTASESNRNRAIPSDNKTGRIGVQVVSSGLYEAYISDGKRICLGYFEKFEDACTTRAKAEIELNYHNNHGRDKIA